jgi:glycerol-3-phosphate dehydrogenase (NAD(P)+)
VVVGCGDEALCSKIQQIISSRSFRVYTSPDIRGVEVAGASKNVIALAAGISDGLGYGDNARAALVCRGASEVTRLGASLECSRETFAGLSGIGDLVATCTSQHSRNHTVGRRIGEGESLGDILASSEKVAEGVETARSMHQLSQKINVELPITTEVYRVLFEGKAPASAVADLMGRELKRE